MDKVDRAAQLGAVTVRAYWSGRTAAQTAEKLAAPLETELAKIKGVEHIVTLCDADSCTISLHYDPSVSGIDIGFAASAAVKRAQLPPGAKAIASASDAGRAPDLVIAAVFDPKLPLGERYAAASDFAYRLMQIPSVEDYDVPGAPVQTTIVEVDPTEASVVRRKLKIDVEDVAKAIEKHILVVDRYRRVIVGRRPGRRGDLGSVVVKRVGPDHRTPVLLKHVARIRTVTTPGKVYRYDGEGAALIHIFLRSAATAEDVWLCAERILSHPRPASVKRVVPVRIRLK